MNCSVFSFPNVAKYIGFAYFFLKHVDMENLETMSNSTVFLVKVSTGK